MKRRCLNPNAKNFADYGGRGIRVYWKWVDSFADFLAHVGRAPQGYSLDRINNDGNYEPGNVRWATYKTQSNNRRKAKRRPSYGLFKGAIANGLLGFGV